jgi:hypothetical protein
MNNNAITGTVLDYGKCGRKTEGLSYYAAAGYGKRDIRRDGGRSVSQDCEAADKAVRTIVEWFQGELVSDFSRHHPIVDIM